MDEPLRVLHFAAGNLFGGVETFLRTLVDCRGVSPGLVMEYAVCYEDRLSAQLRAAGATVHRIGGVRFRWPWTVWRARRRLAALIKERRIDVVVGHCCWAYSLSGPAGRKAGRPVVYWMHEILEGNHWVERRAARVPPDLVLTCSHCAAETLPMILPEARPEVVRYAVMPRAVDRAEARPALRAELKTSSDDVVIISACRFERWKGHHLLVSALGRLRDKAGWTAWIVGGVQRPSERLYLEELKSAGRASGIEGRLRFLGHRDDVPRLLAAADIHCQPNTGPEPFGIAYVEALYAGLPVVSTRMGGAREIVTDSCGLLVPPDDPDALAEALSALIDDRERRTRLGEAGPERAAALCAPEVVMPQMEKLLKEAASSRRLSGRSLAAAHAQPD
ncbi:MAG: hypothetical protein NVSMB9_04440 [Isosphaeraceae bacterium]